MNDMIFTRESLGELTVAYNKACSTTDDETFEFEGNTFLKSYAKYLIEYLENELADPRESN